jgi:hypothetical protein
MFRRQTSDNLSLPAIWGMPGRLVQNILGCLGQSWLRHGHEMTQPYPRMEMFVFDALRRSMA